MPDILLIKNQSDWFWLLLIFGTAWLVLMLYQLLVFRRLAVYHPPTPTPEGPPVSVVISARNEYHNLKDFLEKVLTQDYQEFEVVVVNDRSDDDTAYLLQMLENQYPRLTVIHLTDTVNFFRGKKFPLSVGIKSAKYDILLFTDADCYPVSDQWIRTMVGVWENEKEMIVLGYGGYEKQRGLLNLIIRSETLFTAIQYLGFALAGIPYMGVGRNVMYHRRLFYNAGGFTSHYTLAGGDDDLFINAVARRNNTRICFSPEAVTLSPSKTTFADWTAQKKRHLSTASSYRFLSKMFLSTYWMSHMIFYLSFLLLLVFQYAWLYVLAAFMLRLISLLWLNKKIMRLVGERNLFLFSPLMDVLYLFLNPFILIAMRIAPEKKWK